MPKRGTTMQGDNVWEEIYKAALLETDTRKLPESLQAAKATIDDRLQVLQADHGGTPEERQAISDALAGLNVLRRELEGLRLKATKSFIRSYWPKQKARFAVKKSKVISRVSCQK
jgi:hypothetical protein